MVLLNRPSFIVSGSDDVPDATDPVDSRGNELWPPTEYDALAPLSLPLGPKTVNARLRLAAEVTPSSYR